MYVITGLYCFTLIIQVAYLLTYTISDYSIVIDIFLHKIANLAEAITIFWMLESTGSGLKLISHRLNDGNM